MKLVRVRAVATKELRHILRDPRSLGMGIAIPLLLLLLFGYALALDVDQVPLGVWDQSRTPESRELVARFAGSRYFSVRDGYESYPALSAAIDSRELLAVLVVPADFGDRIGAGREASAQIVVDGSDANTATIALGYANAVVARYSADVRLRAVRREGGRAVPVPLELRPRVWYNPELESKNYIIPGLIAVIMMVIAALLTSLTVAREWERGTMEQLIATPVKCGELILGKLIPYFAIGMLDVVLAVAAGAFLFHVPLRGSGALLFAMAALFLAGALGLGVLISIVTKNQLLASQLAMVATFLPAFLLSGFMYAIANMPKPLQILTHAVPARYFVVIVKGIYLKGVGLSVLGAQAAFLVAFGAVILTVARVRLKKRLD
jgi:ABC-2 type transport system permease protein